MNGDGVVTYFELHELVNECQRARLGSYPRHFTVSHCVSGEGLWGCSPAASMSF